MEDLLSKLSIKIAGSPVDEIWISKIGLGNKYGQLLWRKASNLFLVTEGTFPGTSVF